MDRGFAFPPYNADQAKMVGFGEKGRGLPCSQQLGGPPGSVSRLTTRARLCAIAIPQPRGVLRFGAGRLFPRCWLRPSGILLFAGFPRGGLCSKPSEPIWGSRPQGGTSSKFSREEIERSEKRRSNQIIPVHSSLEQKVISPFEGNSFMECLIMDLIQSSMVHA